MKHFTTIILTVLTLISCSNEKRKTDTNSINHVDSLRQDFNSFYKGVWVLTDYIEEIKKTKSTLKSAKKLVDITTMIIKQEMKGDSVEIGISLNNHEGNSFIAYFSEGQRKNSLKTNIPDFDTKTNYYELGYERIGKETFLFLYHYDKTNKLIDKKQFTKVLEKQSDQEDAAWGLQYFVNKTLIAGDYLLVDSLNTIRKVVFGVDGSLMGFYDFKTYYYVTDYMLGQVPDFDELYLMTSETEEGKCFALKTKNDTTYLYITTGDEYDGTFKLDKLTYRLTKQ
jgi:hypothetical protein